ncbi:hypothetical protein Dsin_004106 [Dipteronia sinensis]|uniref:WAT1-related protein n=1 Tax=Dipteronia sinensis TaxID=43782 RepID=A0AAE0EMS0_9ROSI|nr:hypothetical protein Dsin_004106 [Dipteronia sinensis]
MAVKSWSCGLYERAKPFVGVILLQFGFSGMSIISKFALNKGMSQHVLVVYRQAIAFLVIAPFALIFDRKKRTKMTFSIFFKIVLLGLLEPTIDQNLYYAGMKCTTATFTAAMYNILPAFAFILAWIFRFETVNIRKIHSQAKILGTIVTVGGAMLMTLIKGPMLDLPWTKPEDFNQEASTSSSNVQNPMKGAIMIIVGCVCWAGFIILQANTLKSYPTALSLTALICMMGAIEGSVFALFMEHGNSSAWVIKLDYALLTAVYSGVICSGIAYYVQGVIMKSKGPVFVTAFNPLSMVVIAIMSSFLLAEIMYLGRIIGAIVIVTGLYFVLWGKSKDQLPHSKSNNSSCCSNSNKVAISPSIEDDDDDDQEMAKISDDHDHQRTQISNNQDQSVFVALDHVIIDRPYESV